MTMDETGEDYTEMMCIKCGVYIDKDLLVCPLCDYHYTVIRHPCYVPPEVKYGKKRKRRAQPLTPQTDTTNRRHYHFQCIVFCASHKEGGLGDGKSPSVN